MREFKVFDHDAGAFVQDLDGGDWTCTTRGGVEHFVAFLRKDYGHHHFEIMETVVRMTLFAAVKQIEAAGWKVLLETADKGLRAYAWSDEHGYEFYLPIEDGSAIMVSDPAAIGVMNKRLAKTNAAAKVPA
jgi:hypothetical protein